MKINSLLCTLGILLGGMSVGNSTIIGFGQLGGSNAAVPNNLGSFTTSDGNGYSVSNGTTPNIGLVWDSKKSVNQWQVHTNQDWFPPLENKTVGGGAWDNEGNIPRIGQLDYGDADILFAPDAGYALVLNSFDFGHTAEGGTGTSTIWDFSLLDSLNNPVWSQTLTFAGGQVNTITPNFTGALGASYTLVFHRSASSYASDGRHGIDNLSFNQTTVAIPEPSTIALSLVGAGALLAFRRRK